jgi:deoxyribonuclease V
LGGKKNKIMVVIGLSSRYNRVVKVKDLHSWQVSPAEALDLQMRLASQVSRSNEVAIPRFIAGMDISVNRARGMATGAVVVLNYPELKVVETQVVDGEVSFPYVPGLLSFREAPLTLMACERLEATPDLILVDGQGVAHPRRMGLASHLGLFLDTPTIGCAKSRLCGSHQVPGDEPGSYTELVDRDETIGVALRTKPGTKPVYVSIGHRIDLEAAVYWVMECCRGYRLPEPTRLAHLAAGGNLEPEKDVKVLASDYQGRLFE